MSYTDKLIRKTKHRGILSFFGFTTTNSIIINDKRDDKYVDAEIIFLISEILHLCNLKRMAKNNIIIDINQHMIKDYNIRELIKNQAVCYDLCKTNSTPSLHTALNVAKRSLQVQFLNAMITMTGRLPESSDKHVTLRFLDSLNPL